ncbi:secretin N-terminal domain-containing protein [Alteromonas sp. a30]|uniref:secretin N-terminal domain-containing protein n=1 Tax=Alteromonas sp. a30 TaxID=2730917 RepID=UPI0022803A1F|nr:secretin N-terminal domain-containing protein [Alteromonas sp. a30]MCY7294372.1 hypothetical protein [Alteromonas sp. a30]
MGFSVFSKSQVKTPAKLALLMCMSGLLLQGCATNSDSPFKSVFEKQRGDNSSEAAEAETNKSDEGRSSGSSESLSPFSVDRGNTISTSSEQLELSDAETITVSFEQIPLEQFINHSLANVLKANFVIEPQANMSGKSVTLSIKEKVSQKRYLALFQEVLKQHNLTMKVRNGVVFLLPVNARNGLPDYDYGFGRTKESVPEGSQPIFHVVPIDFIDQKSLTTFLLRLTNGSPEAMADPNLIGIRGARNDVLRALDVISMVDVPKVKGKHISFIKLEYLPSSEFITQVEELLENEGVSVSQVVSFADLTRQNGVVVHSSSPEVIQRINFWREKLDTPESTDDKQYFMYYPENIEAKKLAEVLGKLVSVSQGGRGSSSNSRRTGGASSESSGGGSAASTSNSSRGSSGGTDDFNYVVDENRNVIIIYSDASRYKGLLPLLKKLDVTPSQVLIEARLIEITLTDQFSQGIEWSLFGGGAKREIGTSQLSSFSNGSFSYTISGVDYNAALNLLQSQDRLKVLSSPRIVVANGEKASLNVGTEIPVLSTQAADVDSDRVLQSIQYRSTGVDLTVEPTVNSSNVISMSISQNVSETSENASSGIDSPLILNRSFDTYVIANSGQTLVLGGLIRENNSSDDSKIPLLGDIPVVGKLFRSDSRSTSRTELVVLITPRIISNSSDIDDIKTLFLDELTQFD